MVDAVTVRFDPPAPPSAVMRWLFRLPVYFFRAGLGFLFGSRIAMLEHVGRKSGRIRYTCVEVVDRDGDVLVIVSGFGEGSQWYRNLVAHPAIHVRVGRQRRAVSAELVSPAAGADIMADYAQRYPKLAPKLMEVCGAHIDGTESDYREVAEKRLRFVRLVPRSNGSVQSGD
jgi:deazaflavin-dependent oxidoreductase (nitroreductase family)